MDHRSKNSGSSKAMLFLTALIWGVAFVAQSEGTSYVGAFTFNCCRFVIGGAVLIPCVFFLNGVNTGKSRYTGKWQKSRQMHMGILGGICCGVAYTLQIVAQKHVDPTVASLILSLEEKYPQWLEDMEKLPQIPEIVLESAGAFLVYGVV